MNITIDFLRALKVGDRFNALGLFKGMTPEPTVFTLQEIHNEKDYIFSTTYFGVPMGDVALLIRKNTVSVERL